MDDVSLFAAFRGEHYADPDSLARRLAPPYDVISPPQRAELVARDPYNVVNVDLPVAPDGGDAYAAAAALLAEWRGKDLVDRDLHKIGKLEDVYVDVENDELVEVAEVNDRRVE